MADNGGIQEVNAGGIQAIRQLDAEGFVLETTDGRVYRIALPPGVVGPMGPKGDKGERGVQGEMGSPGADGLDGRDGMNGNDGKDGVSVTLAQVLRNGDLALMLSNGDVINAGKVIGPQGPQGLPGRAGVPGPAGEDGSQIYLTSGPPNPATGQDGDIAIDTANWKLYQSRAWAGAVAMTCSLAPTTSTPRCAASTVVVAVAGAHASLAWAPRRCPVAEVAAPQALAWSRSSATATPCPPSTAPCWWRSTLKVMQCWWIYGAGVPPGPALLRLQRQKALGQKVLTAQYLTSKCQPTHLL